MKQKNKLFTLFFFFMLLAMPLMKTSLEAHDHHHHHHDRVYVVEPWYHQDHVRAYNEYWGYPVYYGGYPYYYYSPQYYYYNDNDPTVSLRVNIR